MSVKSEIISTLCCFYTDPLGETHIQHISGNNNISNILNYGIELPRSSFLSNLTSITNDVVYLYPDIKSMRCIDETKNIYILLLQSDNTNFSKRKLIIDSGIDKYLRFGIEIEFELDYQNKSDLVFGLIDSSQIIDELGVFMSSAGVHCVVKKERGQFQFELNIGPLNATAIADEFLISKFLLKKYALSRGLEISFFPFIAINKECNSAHIHISTVSMTENIAQAGPYQERFVSQFLSLLPDICILSNSTVNSFKRLLKRRYDLNIRQDIPTLVQGRSQGWLRVRDGKTLEFRLPDPFMDIYPLLYIIGTVALDALNSSNPTQTIHSLPMNFEQAIYKFHDSPFLKNRLGVDYLHDKFISKVSELKQFTFQVSEWEKRRYNMSL